MSVSPSKNWSRNSTASRKSVRSGKSLAEKIRELGFNYPQKRTGIWVSSQQIDIKHEYNQLSKYAIMTPNLNLEQITYFQPEIATDESAPGKYVYKINKSDTKTKIPQEIMRISDIEVKSYKPNRKMKFRKRKRHSSIISRIEEILHRGKPGTLTREPSEETVYLEHEAQMQDKNINDLPENIIQTVFSFFSLKERNSVLARVCKLWYYILKDPMFWTELEFYGNKVPKGTIINLIKRYPLIKKLSLTGVPEADEILLELCRCNHNITDLGVRHCIVGSQNFGRIISHVVSCCTNLEVLDIKGMRFQSDRFFLEIGRLKKLRSLNLTGNNMLRTQDLITLSVNCRTLKELKILDIAPEGGQGCLRDEDLTFIVFHLQQNLQVLKIDMKPFTNMCYQAILKCSNLINLTLLNCLHLSSETFREFPILKNLKKLKITRAINLKPEDFQFVFDSESNLNIEDLNINGCWRVGETGLRAITQKLTSLKSISLKNCKSIKGDHLMYLSVCPALTHLNIAHTEVESNYLISLCQYTRALSSLVIDISMYKRPIIQNLQKFFPYLKIKLSFSEYQKDERPLDENQIQNLYSRIFE